MICQRETRPSLLDLCKLQIFSEIKRFSLSFDAIKVELILEEETWEVNSLVRFKLELQFEYFLEGDFVINEKSFICIKSMVRACGLVHKSFEFGGANA